MKHVTDLAISTLKLPDSLPVFILACSTSAVFLQSIAQPAWTSISWLTPPPAKPARRPRCLKRLQLSVLVSLPEASRQQHHLVDFKDFQHFVPHERELLCFIEGAYGSSLTHV
jgi:hypothetical protein